MGACAAFGVEDDGTAKAALGIAGQAVRAFNHRTFVVPEPGRSAGWEYPGDAYRCLGELTYVAGALPQAPQQIIAALRHQLEHELLAVDPGTTYEGDPGAAVHAACVPIECAIDSVGGLYDAVAAAQNAINAVSYAGPDPVD